LAVDSCLLTAGSRPLAVDSWLLGCRQRHVAFAAYHGFAVHAEG